MATGEGDLEMQVIGKDGFIESEEQLAEAKQKLIDAKAEIDALEKGSWTVLDRTSHYASATYHQTVDQMRAIGDVFPLFFILVAALVCLTTMTRMVSEQRGETGLKCELTELLCIFSESVAHMRLRSG